MGARAEDQPQGLEGESRASSVEFEETEKHSEPKIWCLVVHLQEPREHVDAGEAERAPYELWREDQRHPRGHQEAIL